MKSSRLPLLLPLPIPAFHFYSVCPSSFWNPRIPLSLSLALLRARFLSRAPLMSTVICNGCRIVATSSIHFFHHGFPASSESYSGDDFPRSFTGPRRPERSFQRCRHHCLLSSKTSIRTVVERVTLFFHSSFFLSSGPLLYNGPTHRRAVSARPSSSDGSNSCE